MTILNYESLLSSVTITLSEVVGRQQLGMYEADFINQETKERFTIPVTRSVFNPPFGDPIIGLPTVLMTDIINSVGFNINSTFSITVKSQLNEVIYRDIIVFDGRLDTQSDYTENEESGTGYVFG